MARVLLDSYLLLLVASFAATGYDRWQCVMAAVWLAWAAQCGIRGRAAGMPLRKVLGAAALSQAPGLVLAAATLLITASDGTTEWANGLFELWLHPFVPWLSELPPALWHGLSLAYLIGCAVPPAVIGWVAAAWLAADRLSTRVPSHTPS